MQMNRAQIVAKRMQFDHALDGETVLFHGDSMYPFLQDGDELSVRQAAWEEIKPGDIVTYVLKDKFPTLRVVRKQGNRLWLIGDNWPRRKFVAWRDYLLGKVVARKRGGQTVTSSELYWRRTDRHRLWRYRAGWAYSRLRQLPQRIEDRRSRQRDERYDRPINIQLNISSNCNLKCRMCPYLEIHKDPQRMDFMSKETFEHVLPLVQVTKNISIIGAGEPMFHGELFDFIARIREDVPDTKINLTSNGTLLTEARARRLIEQRVNRLTISFDGLPGHVEGIRIGVNGQKVMANIGRLARLKQELGTPYPLIKINYMSGYGTYWDLNEFIELCHENGVSEIQMLEMQPATAEDVADNLHHEMGLDGGAALKSAMMLAAYYGIRLRLPTLVKDICYYPYTPIIGEDGDVYPCCYLDYDGRQLYSRGQEIHLPAMTLGNIVNQPVDEIWHNPDYIALRERNSRGDFDDICQACYDVRLRTAERIEELLDVH